MEAKELVSYQHSQLLKDLSSEVLQKCTEPGMLSKLDFICPNVTVQEYFEVDSQWIFWIFKYLTLNAKALLSNK